MRRSVLLPVSSNEFLESLFSEGDGSEGIASVASYVVKDFCVFSEGY